MRTTCIVCNHTYNCEEVAECIKCKEAICQECIIFEDGNYFCPDCVVMLTTEKDDNKDNSANK
jgi:hypothetical protein